MNSAYWSKQVHTEGSTSATLHLQCVKKGRMKELLEKEHLFYRNHYFTWSVLNDQLNFISHTAWPWLALNKKIVEVGFRSDDKKTEEQSALADINIFPRVNAITHYLNPGKTCFFCWRVCSTCQLLWQEQQPKYWLPALKIKLKGEFWETIFYLNGIMAY